LSNVDIIYVGWAISIITIAIGIWQYADKKIQSIKEPFLHTQLDICLKVTEAAATSATASDPAVWEAARADFLRYFWGPLSVVEDDAVEKQMVAFKKVLDATTPPPSDDYRKLEQPSLKLSHAIRELILRSWKIKNLPDLVDRYV
jgi:hypothetical protein